MAIPGVLKCLTVVICLQMCNSLSPYFRYDSSNQCGKDASSEDYCDAGVRAAVAGFAFAQINPAGFCKANSDTREPCIKHPSMFEPWTIHGLWPTSVQGERSNLCYCNGSSCSLNYVQISTIQGIQQNWPDLINRQGGLWCHEWCKHGTCSTWDGDANDPQTNYFKQVLNLQKKYNFTSILEKHSVVPSKDQTYKLKDFRKAFKKELHARPILVCESKDGQQLLTQIKLCLDEELRPINCRRHTKKEKRKEKCSHEIHYLKT